MHHQTKPQRRGSVSAKGLSTHTWSRPRAQLPSRVQPPFLQSGHRGLRLPCVVVAGAVCFGLPSQSGLGELKEPAEACESPSTNSALSSGRVCFITPVSRKNPEAHLSNLVAAAARAFAGLNPSLNPLELLSRPRRASDGISPEPEYRSGSSLSPNRVARPQSLRCYQSYRSWLSTAKDRRESQELWSIPRHHWGGREARRYTEEVGQPVRSASPDRSLLTIPTNHTTNNYSNYHKPLPSLLQMGRPGPKPGFPSNVFLFHGTGNAEKRAP
jgi:hypothetical protein